MSEEITLAPSFPEINWDKCPNPHLVHGFAMWVEHGIYPGDFLTAVLQNSLAEALMRADGTNSRILKEIVQFVYWELPGRCWGSPEHMNIWRRERPRAAEESEG